MPAALEIQHSGLYFSFMMCSMWEEGKEMFSSKVKRAAFQKKTFQQVSYALAADLDQQQSTQ